MDQHKGFVYLSLSYAHYYSLYEKKASKARQVTDMDSCVTLHAPVQANFLSQDKYSTHPYEVTKDWTHFALVHGTKEILLYIDGKQIISSKAVNFSASKEKLNMTGVFGNREMDALLSGAVCVEGCLEASAIAALCALGE